MRKVHFSLHDKEDDDEGDRDDYEPEIPLQHQRPFGAGLKRKRVAFVPASDAASTSASSQTANRATPTRSGKEVSDIYLSLVMKKAGDTSDATMRVANKSTADGAGKEIVAKEETDAEGGLKRLTKEQQGQEVEEHNQETNSLENDTFKQVSNPHFSREVLSKPEQLSPARGHASSTSSETTSPNICPTCNTPIDPLSAQPHNASLAHQLSLPHSHPPSSIDRRRKGLAYLVRHGWDPDARRGLGLEGQGIQYPIKVAKKEDTLGVGAKLPVGIEEVRKARRETLDAGKVRKLEAEDKRKTEKLRSMFYGNDEVEKYLGRG